MPRVGDVMQLLSGTLAVPNTTIQSAPYNAQQQDWVLDANNPRPITAGGTGATTAAGARTNLGAMGSGDLAAAATKAVPVNTDSAVIIDSAAANVPKRWLVSDMKTAFGPANHDHARLLNGTGTASIDASGNLTAAGSVIAGSSVFYGSAAQWIGAPVTSGSIYLRPNGAGSTAGQLAMDTAGNISAQGSYSTSSSQGIRTTGSGLNGSLYVAYPLHTTVQGAVNSMESIHSPGVYTNFQFTVNSTYFSLISDGRAMKPGGGVWVDTSDARIKTVNGDYESGLAQVLGLRPVRYVYKGNDTAVPPSNTRSGPELADDKSTPAVPYANSSHYAPAVAEQEFVGFVAQEAEAVMPDMVSQHRGYIDGEEVDDIRTVDTANLTFALVNAVREMKAIIDAQAARIEALEGLNGK